MFVYNGGRFHGGFGIIFGWLCRLDIGLHPHVFSHHFDCISLGWIPNKHFSHQRFTFCNIKKDKYKYIHFKIRRQLQHSTACPLDMIHAMSAFQVNIFTCCDWQKILPLIIDSREPLLVVPFPVARSAKNYGARFFSREILILNRL